MSFKQYFYFLCWSVCSQLWSDVLVKTDKFFQQLETTPESVLIICRWKHYDWPLWMSIKSKDEFYWSIFWPKSEYNLRKHALCSSRAGSISLLTCQFKTRLNMYITCYNIFEIYSYNTVFLNIVINLLIR